MARRTRVHATLVQHYCNARLDAKPGLLLTQRRHWLVQRLQLDLWHFVTLELELQLQQFIATEHMQGHHIIVAITRQQAIHPASGNTDAIQRHQQVACG